MTHFSNQINQLLTGTMFYQFIFISFGQDVFSKLYILSTCYCLTDSRGAWEKVKMVKLYVHFINFPILLCKTFPILPMS